MFTYITTKRLKLRDEGTKVAMVLLAMFADFWIIMIVLEGLGIIGGCNGA